MSPYKKRVKKLQKRLQALRLGGFVSLDLTNVRYLTGYTGTSGAVAIFKNSAFFFTDFRYKTQAAAQVRNMKRVIAKSLIEEVGKAIKQARVKRVGYEQERLNVSQFKQLAKAASAKWIAVKPVDELRIIKDEAEIKTMEKNFSMLAKVFQSLSEVVYPGRRENEVSAELQYRLAKLGGSGPSFDFIVASGARSALPHGVASEKKIGKNDIVTLDWGWLLDGYCTDNTRTFFMGKPKRKLLEIHEIVLEANRLAIKKVAPGVPLKDIDAAARDYITNKGYGDKFGHGTGHGVGLEIHEAPNVNPRSKDVARQGMVFTIEPGIYIPGIGGVRIEDVLVVTKNGCKVLTRNIPTHCMGR
jgi:Xaa-Pro aminopeptidase